MKARFFKVVFIINIFFIGQIYAMAPKGEYARAVPIATDTGQIKVLLGLPEKGQYWNDFGGEFTKGKANVAAQNYLKQYTNGVYNITISGMPWKKVYRGQNRTDYFHIVPVQFKRGSELYISATNQNIKDFVWVSPEDIKKGTFIHKGTQKTIADGLKNFFEQYWDELLPSIQPSTPSIPSMPPIQPDPQTARSIGVNNLAPWLSATPMGKESFTNTKGVIKYAKPDYIYFYQSDQQYFEFTNYYRRSVIIDSKTWPTTEHYFQAMKSTNPNEQESIRTLPTPDAARTYWQGKTISCFNWHKGYKELVMLKAMRAKINQHTDIKNLLLGTGNKIIVENTFLANYDDPYWGNGLNDNGENVLGRILMQVRAEQLGIIPVQNQFPYSGPIG